MTVEAPPTTSLRPVGSTYHTALMEAPSQTESGIHLPDQAREGVTDLLVLGVGPGRLRPDGTCHHMQARMGDRVVAQRPSLAWWRDGEVFVRDEDLVAVIRSPEWDEMTAANAWVIVEPDPLERFSMTSGGILRAVRPLYGGDARDMERGERLLGEFRERLERLHLILPGVEHSEERVEQVKRWRADLPVCDQEALEEAYKRTRQNDDKGTGWEGWLPSSSAVVPQSGRVVSVGPQDRPGWHIPELSIVWGDLSYVFRVWWDDCSTVWLGPDRLAVPGEALCACREAEDE